MSKLGEVVFCLDCERMAQASVSAGGGTGPVDTPRHMAVKKDANGDPLCVQCLDLRRANRNAAFLREARSLVAAAQDRHTPAPSEQSAAAPSAVLRIASAVRITRQREAPQRAAAETPKPGRGRAHSTKNESDESSGNQPRAKTKPERAEPAPNSRAAVGLAGSTKSVKQANGQASAARSVGNGKTQNRKPGRPTAASVAMSAREAQAADLAFRRMVFTVGITRAERMLKELKRSLGL
jgi:hypothetical protein